MTLLWITLAIAGGAAVIWTAWHFLMNDRTGSPKPPHIDPTPRPAVAAPPRKPAPPAEDVSLAELLAPPRTTSHRAPSRHPAGSRLDPASLPGLRSGPRTTPRNVGNRPVGKAQRSQVTEPRHSVDSETISIQGVPGLAIPFNDPGYGGYSYGGGYSTPADSSSSSCSPSSSSSSSYDGGGSSSSSGSCDSGGGSYS